ncbi:NAD(P)/FAD-dependent oxidoreductase [Salinispora arenicola]|uniref:NADH dehydrogenase n=1 Tax=Salinispora arenicola TaxID=168697 RepID=A0A542XT59_SALAC|nr:NAD(P)/FAD-dependent oxidoreductase [Salinispora arenicola]MCN0151268.1 NAD(P)/FAD-dependent oxidoreductase [Salinispora arenicola]NIL41219.1 NAD(P)/FAD-dependent oxidoreductase [Salinispora arenicola]TQL38853.1 NADH dehydrogenase [Salinispora arenicola]
MTKPRVVIVGAGFAGYHAAKTLSRLAKDQAEIVLLNTTDYFLYLPLLPEVAAGVVEATRISVPLAGTLDGVRLVVGEADHVDLQNRWVGFTQPEGDRNRIAYDRLVLAVGSVNKLLPIPGVTEYAHGFRGLPEALYVHDHVVRQIELAEQATDPAEQRARSTFVVVGAGYTGTEVAAHGQLFTDRLVGQRSRSRLRPRWMLLDVAPRVLPELDRRMSDTAHQVLDRRGVDVRMGTSVAVANADGVKLTDGEFIPTCSLIWCVGVRPDPFVAQLGLRTEKGRLVTDEYLNVPGFPEVFACGDAAAVPDLAQPGQVCAMTAQHAQRQGKLVAHNVAASYGQGTRRPYKHHDLGWVVDLGGRDAAANPLKLSLAGLPAKVVTRGYHLLNLPGNRARVGTDWLLDATLPRPAVQLGLVPAHSVPLESSSPEVPAHAG